MTEAILTAAQLLAEVPGASEEPPSNFPAAIAICAGILFVSLWLMLRGRLLRSRTTKPTTVTVTPIEPSAAEEKATEHIAEIYETAREITGQLETKIRLLNLLIQDADRAACRLEAAKRGEVLPLHADRAAESPIDEIYLYSDYGLTVFDIASRLEVPVESVEQIIRERRVRK